MALLPMLIQFLLPVALDAAKAKIAAGTVQPVLPDAHMIALQDATTGMFKSKTIWVAFIIGVAGFLEQNQGLLSQYIGADKMGLVMIIVGGVMAFLRTITGSTLSEKVNPPVPEPFTLNSDKL